MRDTLDASAIRRWSIVAADAMHAHRHEIDQLNVFPVPDGDTGTNLALTLAAAADALAADPTIDTAQSALHVMARGAVLGARGNSGVIISQILRGLAENDESTEVNVGDIDPRGFAHRLCVAAERAYEAVSYPLEGTILSVVRAAADAAQSSLRCAFNEGRAESSLAELACAAADAAAQALAHTPEQLPALARAGVVDAGGRGLVVMLQALVATVTEQGLAATPLSLSTSPRSDGVQLPTLAEPAGYEYEVQYLLEAEDAAVRQARAELAALGDSLVLVGTGDGVWNVHVHVDDVGAAIEVGIRAGRPYRISVTRFADSSQPHAGVGQRTHTDLSQRTAIVAVAPGEGLAHLFTAEGVVVVDGGPAGNPSTAEVLAAVYAACASHVVLLPNASQIEGVAETAAAEARTEGIEVAVVPTRSPVQGLAAVAVHDPARRFHDDVVAMAEAAAATRWAEVTVAQRDSLTSVGACRRGDFLGLIDGEVVIIGSSMLDTARSVLDRLVAVGAELMTVVVGRDAQSEDVSSLEAYAGEVAPLVELVVFDGGQPHYPLLIGAE